MTNTGKNNGQNIPAETEKIFVLTGTGKKLLKVAVVCLLLLAAAAILIFHWPLLAENPFSKEFYLQIPVYACRNIHNNLAIIDRDGKCIVTLTPEGRVRSIIQHNPFSKRSISSVLDMDIDEKHIYILDLQPSPNGAQINGERILIYDLDGNYVKTAYELSHPDAAQRDAVLCSISCNNGKCFVAKRDRETIIVSQVADRKLREVSRHSFPGKDIFKARFMADTRSLYVITHDAHYYLNYLNNTEELSMQENNTHWNDVCIAPSGERYYLDSYGQKILQFRPNAKEKQFLQISSRDELKKLTACYGLKLSLQDDVITWCSAGNSNVLSLNVATGQKTILFHAPYSTSFLVFRFIVWFCALLFAVLLMKYLFFAGIRFIRLLRDKNEISMNTKELMREKTVTFWNLYGQKSLTLIFALIAMTAVIGVVYMEKKWSVMESSAKSTAAELSGLPGNVFGDYLEEIDSARDYNSKAFRTLRQTGNSICFSAEGTEFDLGFSLIRRKPDGTFLCVIDTFGRYCTGKPIVSTDPDLADLYRSLKKMKSRKMQCGNHTQRTGDSIFFVLSPIENSKGNIVGAVVISCSKERAVSETQRVLLGLAIKLILLFIIFVLLTGELQLMLAFRKLRKLEPGTGKLLHTVCEGHRSCQFLTSMALYLDAAFLPAMAIELAQRSGFTGNVNFLAALPLSLRSLMLVASLLIGGVLSKYNPGKYLKWSAFLSVFCYLFLIHAIGAGQYVSFLLGIAALGVMHGLKNASLNAISICGLEPTEKFKNMVFLNTEYLLGAAVGTSVGSLLCEKFGYVPVFWLGLLLELLLFYATKLFIAKDINLPHPAVSQLKEPLEVLMNICRQVKKDVRYVLSPEMLALLFCVMVPISILSQFDGFVLPIYNVWSGYSQLLTGFIGTVTKILALLLIPFILNKLAARGNRTPIIVGMLALIIWLSFFAINSQLMILGGLLLVITIFHIIFVTMAGRLRQASATRHEAKYHDVYGVFNAVESLGASTAPLLLGFWLNRYGFSFFGYAFAGILTVLLILFLIFSSGLRRSVIGKCQ